LLSSSSEKISPLINPFDHDVYLTILEMFLKKVQEKYTSFKNNKRLTKAIKEVSIMKDKKQKWVKPEIKDRNAELNPVFVCYVGGVQTPCTEYSGW